MSISISVSLLVSLLGSFLLRSNELDKLGLIFYCFVIAGCHYCLVKSVQPDPASPQHGFNRIILFSRPLLFCLLASVFLISQNPFSDTGLSTAYNTLPSVPGAAHPWDIRVGCRRITINWGELSQLTRSDLFFDQRQLLPRDVLVSSLPVSSHLSSESPQISSLPVSPFPGGWPHRLDAHKGSGNEDRLTGLMPTVSLINRSSEELSELATPDFQLFGYNISVAKLTSTTHLTTIRVLSAFPLLFLLGLVPQVNTLVIYLCEQVDIHVLGGSGAAGLFSVMISIFRSLFCLFICYWPSSLAFSHRDPHSILVSVFWGLQLTVCYILSRLPSNISLYATALLLLFRPSLSRNDKLSWRTEISMICTSLNEYFGATWRVFRVHWRKRTQNVRRRKKYSSIAWWRRCYLSLLSSKSLVAVGGGNKPGPSETSNPLLTTVQRSASFCHAEVSLVDGEQQSTPSPTTYTRAFCSEPEISSLQCCNSDANLPSEGRKRFKSFVDIHSCRPSSTLIQHICDEKQLEPEATQTNVSIDLKRNQEPCTNEEQSRRLEYSNTALPEADRPNNIPYSDRHSTSIANEQSVDLKHGRESMPVNYTAGDPLQFQIHRALIDRFVNDSLLCLLWFPLGFGLHRLSCLITNNNITNTTVLTHILISLGIFSGFWLHYVWPNLRKTYPWLCFTMVPFPPHCTGKIMGWEIAYVWLCRFESTCLLPFIAIFSVTQAIVSLVDKFGLFWATLILMVTSMKMLRNTFSAARLACLSLFFTQLMFNFDYARFSETLPVNYFLVSIFLVKVMELFRKLHFVYMYTAPCRITWGSVTHAFIHIAFIPHSVFMLTNCFISAFLSSPLEPFLASAIFITSYVRPIKFWEISHHAERMETTNTSLATQLHGISSEHVATNLNALFYERLARNIQQTLAGDIYLGRLGGLTVEHGDFFIMGSDEFNFVVHIIEVANGLVTFQLRGLEFLGTYCHERETEALRHPCHNDDRCCCWEPGHIPGMLSFNAALRMRSMTWQFIYSTYCVEGYHISNYGVDAMIKLPDFKKLLIGRFIRCIVYYVMKLPNLAQRLESLVPHLTANNFFSEFFVDLDPVFQRQVDQDFDDNANGVTRQRFYRVHMAWIHYCHAQHPNLAEISCGRDSPLVTLCFALTLLGRRCVIGTQSANYESPPSVCHSHSIQQIFRGIHDVFKGDVHVHTKDEWVLADVYLLQSVITLSMRIVLKLCEDSFLYSSEKTRSELYRTIAQTEQQFVICHETDPGWRYAVLNNAPRLFSIRRVGTDSCVYNIMHMNKSQLQFSAVKINPECVRGLWAGQQREQIYLRNMNSERGSIQGAQHVLRNLVNSSCDPPIGYPIYVSPLLTSFVGTNQQYCQVAGPELSPSRIVCLLRTFFCRLLGRKQTRTAGSRRPPSTNLGEKIEMTDLEMASESRCTSRPSSPSALLPAPDSSCHLPDVLSGSTTEGNAPVNRLPRVTTAALVHEQAGSSRTTNRVKLVDPAQILNDRFGKLAWPSNDWIRKCVTDLTQLSHFNPDLEGEVIHRWTPNNPVLTARSYCHRVIALVAFPNAPKPLTDWFVLIWEDKGLVTATTADCGRKTTVQLSDTNSPHSSKDATFVFSFEDL